MVHARTSISIRSQTENRLTHRKRRRCVPWVRTLPVAVIHLESPTGTTAATTTTTTPASCHHASDDENAAMCTILTPTQY